MSSSPSRSRAILVGRIVFPLLLIALLFMIFGYSSDTGEASGGKSAAVAAFLNGGLEALGIPWRISEFFVRKAAHFTEYAVLGLLAVFTWRLYARAFIRTLGWPLLFGLLVAVCDETFQTFIPGRAGQVTDVLIDFAGVVTGALCALVVIAIVAHLLLRRRYKRLRDAADRDSAPIDTKDRIRDFYERVTSLHLLDEVPDYIADNCVVRTGDTITPVGLAGMIQHLIDVRHTYPDLTMTILRQFQDGDCVISEFVAHATHGGEWLGMKPSSHQLTFTGVNIDRVANGKIIEHGGAMNTFEALFDAGLIQATPQ